MGLADWVRNQRELYHSIKQNIGESEALLSQLDGLCERDDIDVANEPRIRNISTQLHRISGTAENLKQTKMGRLFYLILEPNHSMCDAGYAM